MSLILQTDTYKTGHHEQYPPGTEKIYSYMEARKSREDGLDYTVFKTLEDCTPADEDSGELETVFLDGAITRTQTIDEIRSILDLTS